MESFIKADIFFFVTTVVTLVAAVLVVWILVYVLRIVRRVDEISETVKQETTLLVKDIDEAREGVKNGIKSFPDRAKSMVFSFMKLFFPGTKGRKRK